MKELRNEIMRLMREDFDPTPANWEGRDWNDNAKDVADKIMALLSSEKHTLSSDAQCCQGLAPQSECQCHKDEIEKVRLGSSVGPPTEKLVAGIDYDDPKF